MGSVPKVYTPPFTLCTAFYTYHHPPEYPVPEDTHNLVGHAY